MNDEPQIRQILQAWAEATRTGRQDDILANHAPDVLIFDALPPLQYKGAAAYRKSWDEWHPETTGEGVFVLNELEVTAGQDVAFAHGLVHCGSTAPDGSAFEDDVRATFCLRRIDGRWLVVHQHISMPAGAGRDEG